MKKEYRYKNKEWLKNALVKYKTVDKLCKEEKEAKTSIYRYIKLFQLKDFIEHPAQNKKYIFNDKFFQHIDSEEKAYWLGMLMADGNVTNFDRKSYVTRITLKEEDIYHVEKFCKAIDLDKNIYINKYKQGSITIHSKQMYMDLLKQGVLPQKTGKEKFPNLNDELTRHFIRGFFDGDGTIYARKQKNAKRKRSLCVIGFVCVNKEFLDDLLKVLYDKCKIKITNHFCPKKKVYECKTESIEYCKTIIDYLYKDASVYLKRKYSVAQDFLDKLSKSGRRSRKQIG